MGVERGIWGEGVERGIWGEGVERGIWGEGVERGIWGGCMLRPANVICSMTTCVTLKSVD